MKEQVASIDPLLDARWASAEVARLFGAQLDAVEELRDYGCALLKRLIATTVREVPDLVVVAGLFRQFLAGIDGYLVCARVGAAHAARLHLRSQLEASLYIEWILRHDRELWARRLYVANARSARRWARRMIPGTEEHRQYTSAWQVAFDSAPPIDDAKVRLARNQDRSSLDIQELPTYEPTYREFESFRASHGGREALWHELGPGGVPSLYAMAKTLQREAEYITLYESYSDAAHGARTDNHFRKLSDGGVEIDPIRDVGSLQHDLSIGISMPLRVFMLLLDTYRPDEREVFARNYLEKWRDKLQMPKVDVRVRHVRMT